MAWHMIPDFRSPHRHTRIAQEPCFHQNCDPDDRLGYGAGHGSLLAAWTHLVVSLARFLLLDRQTVLAKRTGCAFPVKLAGCSVPSGAFNRPISAYSSGVS